MQTRVLAFGLVASLALLTFVPGGAADAPPADAPKLSETPLGPNEELVAVIEVTHGKESWGNIEVHLHDKYAPVHVRNFVKLAESGFYDGIAFHRVGPESFVQGGDPLSRDSDPANDGTGGPGYDLIPEPNDKEHARGAFAAASMGKRDNGSQFFIDLKDHPEWNGKYTVFGSVMAGIEIADKIAAQPRKGDHPVDPCTMTVRVEKRVRKMKLY